MEYHWAANLFPLLEGTAFDELCADIVANGLHEPIVTDRKTGHILDGRNRHRACRREGIMPVFEWYDGDDPLGYVISLNLHRRHLDESQRAMVFARIAQLPKGVRSDSQMWLSTPTQAQAADMLNVSVSTGKLGKTVLADGAPELVQAVECGEVAVSTAATLTALPQEEQAELVARGEKEILAAAKAIRAERTILRREERTEALKAKEWPSGVYRVIYADPPWQYGNTTMDDYGHTDRHYETMPTEDICALPVTQLADKDAVLFLWATSPLIEQAFQIARAWGFEYKACFVWDKVKHNFGHYNSIRHEFLLLCTRGSCLPDIPDLLDSVVSIERTEHSTKPEEFRQIIDTLYQNGPRIELFARRPADGWEVWGNELS